MHQIYCSLHNEQIKYLCMSPQCRQNCLVCPHKKCKPKHNHENSQTIKVKQIDKLIDKALIDKQPLNNLEDNIIMYYETLIDQVQHINLKIKQQYEYLRNLINEEKKNGGNLNAIFKLKYDEIFGNEINKFIVFGNKINDIVIEISRLFDNKKNQKSKFKQCLSKLIRPREASPTKNKENYQRRFTQLSFNSHLSETKTIRSLETGPQVKKIIKKQYLREIIDELQKINDQPTNLIMKHVILFGQLEYLIQLNPRSIHFVIQCIPNLIQHVLMMCKFRRNQVNNSAQQTNLNQMQIYVLDSVKLINNIVGEHIINQVVCLYILGSVINILMISWSKIQIDKEQSIYLIQLYQIKMIQGNLLLNQEQNYYYQAQLQQIIHQEWNAFLEALQNKNLRKLCTMELFTCKGIKNDEYCKRFCDVLQFFPLLKNIVITSLKPIQSQVAFEHLKSRGIKVVIKHEQFDWKQ